MLVALLGLIPIFTLALAQEASPTVRWDRAETFRINFPGGGSTISPAQLPVLARIRLAAQSYQIFEISVEGHADTSGSPDRNLILSQQRAEVVAAGLKNEGISPERLRVAWYGEAHPFAPGADRRAQALSRRVEITLRGKVAGQ